MFLPTKAHAKTITQNQYKLRLGTQVPSGAVNLGYTSTRPIHSEENILITDLSDTIIENNKKNEIIYMHPNTALLLETLDKDSSISSKNIKLTNTFKDGHPLFYCFILSYLHYDEEGADEYAVYNRNSISIVDRIGNPVTKPYLVKLLKDENNLNLYHVKVYCSFNDTESDNYYVLYNAVDAREDGTYTTYLGYKEPLNLKPAIEKTHHISNILSNVYSETKNNLYYIGNSERIGQNKVFVSEMRQKDMRIRDDFKYQVIAELTVDDKVHFFYSPYYVSSVLHIDDLLPVEREIYQGDIKAITKISTKELMNYFIPTTFIKENTKYRYFVFCDNPDVIVSTRIDGTSVIFAKTEKQRDDNKIKIPKENILIKEPVEHEAVLTFMARPMFAEKNEESYISIVMDNSKSMTSTDEGRIVRFKMLQYINDSCYNLYHTAMVNGYRFEHNASYFKSDFSELNSSIIELFSKNTPSERDVTNPLIALEKAIEGLEAALLSNKKNKTLHRYIFLVTDGGFNEYNELGELLKRATKLGIRACVIAIKEYETLNEICKKNLATCIDASKPQPLVDFNKFFFDGLAFFYKQEIGAPLDFTISPEDKSKLITTITKDSFELPSIVEFDKKRFAIEVILHDGTKKIEVSIKNNSRKREENLYFGATIIPVQSLENIETLSVYARSAFYNDFYSPIYALSYDDTDKIRVLPPREKHVIHPWYIRIQNGRFDRIYNDEYKQGIWHYSVPEYYRQNFLPEGYPYRQIKNERPLILSENKLQLSHTPLHCNVVKADVKNIIILINGKKTGIKNWESLSGVITIDGSISINDDIRVTYDYIEMSYTYKGYYNKTEDRFFFLDLNPSDGHFITIRDPQDGQIKDVPSFLLINSVVYIYIKPSSYSTNTFNGDVSLRKDTTRYTVFHSFEKMDNSEFILIAEIRVRPNSRKENIKIVDTRTPGGGLLESITVEKMKEIEEESLFYWDIGHWDGMPYSESGIFIVRLSKYILNEYGGSFTKQEVEEKLNRYMGYGILAIIEFVEDSNSLLQVPGNLNARVIEVAQEDESIVFKPTFSLSLEE